MKNTRYAQFITGSCFVIFLIALIAVGIYLTQTNIDTNHHQYDRQHHAEDQSWLSELSPEDVAALSEPNSYPVVNGKISSAMPEDHQILWDTVTALLPLKARQHIGSFEIISGEGDEDGFVEQQENGGAWHFAISGALLFNIEELQHTIIHEYAHILSLNSQQISEENPCHTYEIDEGCAAESSYIYRFYTHFWAGKHNEKTGGDPLSLDFVTEYAATNPIEDFADSFAMYVLGYEAESLEIQAKYDLFSAYPQLVTLTAHMQSNLLDG